MNNNNIKTKCKVVLLLSFQQLLCPLMLNYVCLCRASALALQGATGAQGPLAIINTIACLQMLATLSLIFICDFAGRRGLSVVAFAYWTISYMLIRVARLNCRYAASHLLKPAALLANCFLDVNQRQTLSSSSTNQTANSSQG